MPIYYIAPNDDNRVVSRSEGASAAKEAAGFVGVESALDLHPNDAVYNATSDEIEAVPEPTEAEALAAAKQTKQGYLLGVVNLFIAQKPDGKTRYDNNLKMNLIDWRGDIRDINADASATAGQIAWAAAALPLIESVKAWITAVQTAYLTDRKAAVAAAVDLEALEAVDVSYEWFEARYGLAGSVLADPDIYTSDIVAAGS